MLSRIRKAKEENEGGFTLIELLVVIIIIGILAAIAIPVFLNQRQKGYDAAIKSDLRNAATAEETYLTDNNAYSSQTPVGTDLTGLGFKYSGATNYDSTTGQKINVKVTGSNQSFCLDAKSASGKIFRYDSAGGGVTSGAACP
jgi:type IV pilus assembly protein PilA